MAPEVGPWDKPIYDYYFYLNGEEIKADYCFSILGHTSCEYSNVTFTNVTFEKRLIDVEKNYYSYVHDSLLLLGGLIFLWFVLLIFKDYVLRG